MVHSIDSKGRIISVSNYWLKVMGYNEKDVIGLKSTEFLTEASKNYATEVVLPDFFKRGYCTDISYQFIKKNGEIIDVLLSSTSEKDDSGKVIQSLAVLIDVTERKEAEEALQESEERFRSLIESMNEWAWEVNAEGIYNYVSPQVNDLLGYRPEEILGKTLFDIILPDDKERVVREMDSIVKNPCAFQNLEKRCLHKDGRIVILEASGVPIVDKIGTLIGFKGINRDITERKLAEKEVQQLNQFRESIIDNANIWLNVLDEKGNVLIWNKAAESISGYTKEEVVGHGKIWEWSYPDKEYRDEMTTKAATIIKKNKVLEDFETTIQRKDRKKRIISWHSRNLIDDHGNPIGSIALGRDITERQLAEKEKMKAQKVAAENKELALVGQIAGKMAIFFFLLF